MEAKIYTSRIGEAGLARIKHLNDLREKREPLQRQLDKLKKEEEELTAQKKSIPAEIQKQIAEIEGKLEKLPGCEPVSPPSHQFRMALLCRPPKLSRVRSSCVIDMQINAASCT